MATGIYYNQPQISVEEQISTLKNEGLGFMDEDKAIDCSAIARNDYNLSVSSYVETEDTTPPDIDIQELNQRIKTNRRKRE